MQGATKHQGLVKVGIARKCESEGGIKVEFTDYILDLWKNIGYSPDNVNLSEIEANDTKLEELVHQEGGSFIPPKVHPLDTSKFTGVTIKQLPRDADQGEVVEFLINCGLSENHRDKIKFGIKGIITIIDISNRDCLALIGVIHEKHHFGKKLFYNGILPLTPEKPLEPPEPPTSSQSSNTPKAPKPLPPKPQNILETSAVDHKVESFKTSAHQFNLEDFPDYETVVRRHSVSLTNRTPPRHSLAADILGSRPHLGITSGLMASISDLQDQLSEFNSCQELSDSSQGSSEDDTKQEDLLSWNKSTSNKKKDKKRKRKLALTPGKEHFLKKQNTQISPK